MLKVRRVEESDRELLMQAALSDPFHAKAGLTGEHWMAGDSLLYADDVGPVVAIRTRNVVRADIQFVTQDALRNSSALAEGFWKYIEILSKRGVTEVIFNTESPAVAHFFTQRFRFREVSPGTYTLRII